MRFKYSLTDSDFKFKVVCLGLLEMDGKIVLAQHEGSNYFYGKWGFPVAVVRVGENILEAAVRGFKEDTNLEVEVESLIGIYKWYSKEVGSGFIYYTFGMNSPKGKLKPNHKDVLNVQLFDYQDFFKMHPDSLKHKQLKDIVKRYRRGETYPLHIVQDI